MAHSTDIGLTRHAIYRVRAALATETAIALRAKGAVADPEKQYADFFAALLLEALADMVEGPTDKGFGAVITAIQNDYNRMPLKILQSGMFPAEIKEAVLEIATSSTNPIILRYIKEHGLSGIGQTSK